MSSARRRGILGVTKVMASWSKRRIVGIILTLVVVAALAIGVGLRVSKRAAAETPAGGARAVTLEFAAADLAFVEPAALTRWLPLSGTMQPVDQTTVIIPDLQAVLSSRG